MGQCIKNLFLDPSLPQPLLEKKNITRPEKFLYSRSLGGGGGRQKKKEKKNHFRRNDLLDYVSQLHGIKKKKSRGGAEIFLEFFV